MSNNKNQSIIKNIEKVLNDKVSYKKGNLFHIVSHVTKKSKQIKSLVNKNKTPFYVFDQQNILPLSVPVSVTRHLFNKSLGT